MVNRYIGLRYVPKFCGEWDINKPYEQLSIVTVDGNSFTSKKTVPVGTALSNSEYWVQSANYNAQIEYYRQEVNQALEDMQELKDESIQEFEEIKTDTIADVTQIKDSAISEMNTIKSSAISETTNIKNTAITEMNGIKTSAISDITAIKDDAIEQCENLIEQAESIVETAKINTYRATQGTTHIVSKTLVTDGITREQYLFNSVQLQYSEYVTTHTRCTLDIIVESDTSELEQFFVTNVTLYTDLSVPTFTGDYVVKKAGFTTVSPTSGVNLPAFEIQIESTSDKGNYTGNAYAVVEIVRVPKTN